jgi:hypothetical protein
LSERRAKLIEILDGLPDEARKTLIYYPVVEAKSWEELAKIRDESRSAESKVLC